MACGSTLTSSILPGRITCYVSAPSTVPDEGRADTLPIVSEPKHRTQTCYTRCTTCQQQQHKVNTNNTRLPKRTLGITQHLSLIHI
eukprot:1294737-Rhodomonas_salina.1